MAEIDLLQGQRETGTSGDGLRRRAVLYELPHERWIGKGLLSKRCMGSGERA